MTLARIGRLKTRKRTFLDKPTVARQPAPKDKESIAAASPEDAFEVSAVPTQPELWGDLSALRSGTPAGSPDRLTSPELGVTNAERLQRMELATRNGERIDVERCGATLSPPSCQETTARSLRAFSFAGGSSMSTRARERCGSGRRQSTQPPSCRRTTLAITRRPAPARSRRWGGRACCRATACAPRPRTRRYPTSPATAADTSSAPAGKPPKRSLLLFASNPLCPTRNS